MYVLLLKYWKEVLLGLLLVVMIITLFYVRTLKLQNEKLDDKVTVQNELIGSLNENIRANKEALLEREETVRILEDEKNLAHQALSNAVKEDPKACEWSKDIIPESVLEAIGCGK
jgi:hypothetical protein